MQSLPQPLVNVQNMLRCQGEFDAAWRISEVYIGFKSDNLQLKIAHDALMRESGYRSAFMVEEADGFFYMALVKITPEERVAYIEASRVLGSLLKGLKCLPQPL